MRALYDIDQDILDCVDLETGEILDTEKLDALQMEREAKLEGVALWVKDLRAEAEADGLTLLAIGEGPGPVLPGLHLPGRTMKL